MKRKVAFAVAIISYIIIMIVLIQDNRIKQKRIEEVEVRFTEAERRSELIEDKKKMLYSKIIDGEYTITYIKDYDWKGYQTTLVFHDDGIIDRKKEFDYSEVIFREEEKITEDEVDEIIWLAIENDFFCMADDMHGDAFDASEVFIEIRYDENVHRAGGYAPWIVDEGFKIISDKIIGLSDIVEFKQGIVPPRNNDN